MVKSPALMIKLIVYDLDGTLIDSSRDIADAVNWVLQNIGLKGLPPEQIRSFVGSGVTHLMRQVLENTSSPAPASLLDRSIRLFRRRYAEHLLDQTVLYPSVRKVLEFFKDRRQAVVTNKPHEFSLQILKGLGVDSYFCEVIGGDQGFPKKPAPEVLLEILRRTSVLPQESVFVGDSAIDVETGQKAGVKTLAVTYGFGKREEIEASRPSLLLEDLEELIPCPLLKI